MSSKPKPVAIYLISAQILICIAIYLCSVLLRRHRHRQQNFSSCTSTTFRAILPLYHQPTESYHYPALNSSRRRTGLHPSVINSFPIIPYNTIRSSMISSNANHPELDCALCLNPFTEDQDIRFIPICKHVFHPMCINSWLSLHSSCPYCRTNLQRREATPRRRRQQPSTSSHEVVIVVTVRNEGIRGYDHHGFSSPTSDDEVEEEENSTDETPPRENNERYTLNLPDEFWRSFDYDPRAPSTTRESRPAAREVERKDCCSNVALDQADCHTSGIGCG